MKLFSWHKTLESQHLKYGKDLYTISELAHLSGHSPKVLNVELSRLVKQGVIARYAKGLYGRPNGVKAEDILPFLDKHSYITAAYALSRYNLVTQFINRVTCFTNRRHNRSRLRETPLGTFEFISVSPSLYKPPAKGLIASKEQALLEYIYLCRRKGLNPWSLVSFRKLNELNLGILENLLPHFPSTVRRELRSNKALERIRLSSCLPE